jgi:hypothetical protein
MRASTGLWEPWGGNDPGPPGPKQVKFADRCESLRWGDSFQPLQCLFGFLGQ